jgi:hypothetical protein
VILFASQILASLMLSVFCGITAKNEANSKPFKKLLPRKVSDAFIASAADAAHAMINMCCFVVLFATLLNLLRLWVTSPQHSAVLSALLEVTGGCSDIAKLGAPLWIFALAIGWGGICVHFQIISSVANIKINLARFVFFRLLHGVLAALITFGLVWLFPLSTEVFRTTSVPLAGSFTGSFPSAAALIGLCMAFILSLPQEELEIQES